MNSEVFDLLRKADELVTQAGQTPGLVSELVVDVASQVRDELQHRLDSMPVVLTTCSAYTISYLPDLKVCVVDDGCGGGIRISPEELMAIAEQLKRLV